MWVGLRGTLYTPIMRLELNGCYWKCLSMSSLQTERQMIAIETIFFPDSYFFPLSAEVSVARFALCLYSRVRTWVSTMHRVLSCTGSSLHIFANFSHETQTTTAAAPRLKVGFCRDVAQITRVHLSPNKPSVTRRRPALWQTFVPTSSFLWWQFTRRVFSVWRNVFK